MRRKKKAFAVMIPALVLVATAVETAPAGAAAPRPGERAGLAADPSEPPGEGGTDPGGGGSGDPGGVPRVPGDGSADPGGAGQDPDGGRTGDGQDGNGRWNGGRSRDPQNFAGPGQGGGGQGLSRALFADIRKAPALPRAANGQRGSAGTFTSKCGRNEGQKHSNPDNVIVAPGVQNGAHHTHDYVGNKSTDGFSTDESLAASGTTCTNGDKSTYYWPVMRLRAGRDNSAAARQSTADGNIGSVVTPSSVQLQFNGNARSKVTAMPPFMRVLMGDAKAGTNGTANAKALWSCTGFLNRGFTDRYPLCPQGSQVARVLEFPSCWDGRNSDSANHRDHVLFADERTGACPPGRRPVPQLQMTLTYNVPARAQAFALDSFPEQLHDPVTDHADFINVMSRNLMQQAVGCINSGRRC
ncbi:DUF1996 domain-containing protein [Actinomadura graeca]|uniref:DUF1996 domain-containing protein n=1 Tax=Actinomadura graeca TaxID=2750812 RepID=A0ABX8R2G4_9ACTN|nr:DUF1996 domain-containing protein [Actinomadura graeca]QXJ25281.1 DUF1996 domain-containing protein [Actinomadura graeca]